MTVTELEAALPEKAMVYHAAGGGWIVRVPPLPRDRKPSGGFHDYRRFKRVRLIDALLDALSYLAPHPTEEDENDG